MKCPSCSRSLRRAMVDCEHCGMNLGALDEKFGRVPRHSMHITDHTNSLTDKQGLGERIRTIEREYPQLRVSFVFTELLDEVDLREYTFWMFNRGHFSPVTASAENNFTVMFLVECRAKAVCMMVGYGLESLIQPEEMRGILDAGAAEFQHGDYAKGAIALLEALKPVIEDKSYLEEPEDDEGDEGDESEDPASEGGDGPASEPQSIEK